MLSESAKSIIQLALREDLQFGDPLAETLFESRNADGKIIAREQLVLSGVEVAAEVFRVIDPRLSIELVAENGDVLEANDVILRVHGSLASLLSAERTALNFLGRLSGVASFARELSKKAPDLKLLDTRKTTPGLRDLEKRAVLHGGGANHRLHLSDLLMLKSTAIDGAGRALSELVSELRSSSPYRQIEVEVRNEAEFREALAAKADIVMLDNMTAEQMTELVAIRDAEAPEVLLEASGGITADSLSSLVSLGIDAASTSAFSTRSVWKDVSFRVGEH